MTETAIMASAPQTVIEHEAANSVLGLIKRYVKTFEGVLPKHLTKERFAWLAVNSVRQTPALAGCTPASFMNSVLLAANMGLEIRRNSAYLIPYGKECQLLIDYRGKVDLARRSGVRAMPIELVHEADLFECEIGSKGTVLRHRPLKWITRGTRNLAVPSEDRGDVVCGYAMAFLADGEPQVELMSLDQIEAIRRRSKSGAGVPFTHYGKAMPALSLEEIRKLNPATMAFKDPYRLPWVTDWDQMARKTLAHRICNYIPQNPQISLSQEVDESAETGNQMPVSEQMAQLLIDPADNRPMVDIPDDPEERRAAQLAIVEQKTGVDLGSDAPEFKDWGAVKAAHDNDENAAELGMRVRVGKKLYTRTSFESTWTEKK
jgi:recombination protein RecT